MTFDLEIIKATSCHGISHFSNATSKNIRTFWFFCTLSCIGALSYFVILRLKDYITSDVVASFKIEQSNNLQFPKITVCQSNTFDDTNLHYFFYQLKLVLTEIFRQQLFFSSSGFKITLAEFMYSKIKNKRRTMLHDEQVFVTGQGNVHSDYSNQFMHYTNKILTKIVLDPKIDAFPFAYYWMFPEKIEEHCSEQEISNWAPKFLSERCNSTWTDFSLQPEQYDYMFWLCPFAEKFDNGTFTGKGYTDDQLCSFKLFSPFIEDQGHFFEMSYQAESIDFLASEVVYDWLFAKDPYDLYNNHYGEGIKYYIDPRISPIDHYLEYGKQFADCAKNKTRTDPLFFDCIDSRNLPDPNFENLENSFISAIESLHAAKAKHIEAIKKGQWMTQLTNLDDKLHLNPTEIEYMAAIWVWYFMNYDPDEYDPMVKNFKLSEQKDFYQIMEAETNILYSRFGEKVYENVTDMFENTISPKSNNCLQLKTDQLDLYQDSNGENAGLYFFIFTGDRNKANTHATLDFSVPAKMTVSVDLPDSQFSDVTVTTPVSFENGKITKIILEKTAIEKDPKFPGCSALQTDSIIACRQKCFVRYITDVESSGCGCLPAFALNGTDRNNKNENECTFEQLIQTNCYESIVNFKNMTMSEVNKKCNCEQPCSSSSYKITTLTGRSGFDKTPGQLYFSKDYLSILKKAISGNSFSKAIEEFFFNRSKRDTQRDYFERVLSVHSMSQGILKSDLDENDQALSSGLAVLQIYFEDLTTNLMEESAADKGSSLVSDLGGQLGLWLGISMVSIMEVVICFYSCCGKKKFSLKAMRNKLKVGCDEDDKDLSENDKDFKIDFSGK